MAVPSNWDKKPSPSEEAKLPKAGKQAAQLSADKQVPPEPSFSIA